MYRRARSASPAMQEGAPAFTEQRTLLPVPLRAGEPRYANNSGEDMMDNLTVPLLCSCFFAMLIMTQPGSAGNSIATR